MTSDQQIHLTEDELDEALMGTATVENMAHLKVCAVCSAHLGAFTSTVAIFNDASEAWSNAKSNALSRDLKQHVTPFRLTASAAWSCASIGFLAAAAVLGVGVHHHSQQIAESQTALAGTQVEYAYSDENARREIASDDSMLRQIDSAINTSEPSPEELYGSGSASEIQNSNPRRTQVRD